MTSFFFFVSLLSGGLLFATLLFGKATAIEKLRFCLRDVVGGASWRTSLAMLITVFGVCLLSVVAFGLFSGAERVQIRRIEQQPLALRLRANRMKLPAFEVQYLMQDLKPDLEERFGKRLTKFSPFRVRELRIRIAPDSPATSVQSRTVHLDKGQDIGESALIRHLNFRPAEALDNSVVAGVILCPQGLAKLGLGINQIPSQIYFDIDNHSSRNSKTIAVAVLGVLSNDLPENVDVIFTEDVERKLFYAAKPVLLDRLIIGSFPDSWDEEQFDTFKAGVEKVADSEIALDWEVAPPFDDPLHRELWLTSQEATEYESFWKEELSKVQSVLNNGARQEDASELVAKNLPAASTDAKGPNIYHYLGLYFTDPLALPVAADYLETLPQFKDRKVDRGQADQVANVQKLSAAHLKVLDVFRVIVGMFVFLNLLIIQVLRAQQKNAEAGMLRAVGMNHLDMLGIVCLESGIVWAFGALTGIVFGEIVGRAISCFLYDMNLASAGFTSNWNELLLVLSVTALITLISAILGSLRWFLVAPGVLMSDD